MAIALEDLEGHRKSIGEGLVELKTTTPERAKELLERMKSSLESLRKSADDTLTKFR
jgi:hypothetical protein